MAFFLLVAGLFLAPFAFADRPTFGPQDTDDYDTGQYGAYPELNFRTTSLVSPKILRRTWSSFCDSNATDYYYFLAVYGWANKHKGPLILDYSGQMVWHSEDYGNSYGFMVQEYHGEPHLTWWAGNDSIRGHGIGSYYMLDNTYTRLEKFGALNNLPSDLHEFLITKENTIIVTSFVQVPRDLEGFEMPANGFIWDCIFQEFDRTTNKVLFEWRASDWFDLADCGITVAGEGTKDHPWDWFHLNSIDKDPKGNYLISARYCGIAYVSGQTGHIFWYLGGKKNSFDDLSEGLATSMIYQHHVRWTDDYTAITLLDNQAANTYERTVPSRGMKVKLNTWTMTAEVLNQLVHPTHWMSWSQGSMQSLENGNFLIGYGHTPVVTEFFPNGDVACEIQFAPSRIGVDGSFTGGAAQSYRVFRQRWVGMPTQDPKVFFEGDSPVMYVSWNGATKVRRWRLEASTDRNSWIFIDEIQKSGFESKLSVDHDAWNVFRLTALDSDGQKLGNWILFTSGTVQSVPIAEDGLESLAELEKDRFGGQFRNNYVGSFSFMLMGTMIIVIALYWYRANVPLIRHLSIPGWIRQRLGISKFADKGS